MFDPYELAPAIAPDTQGLTSIRIKGDAFLDALIKDGDLVLIRRQSTAEHGDLVTAHLKDQERSVIRRYGVAEDGNIRLAAVDPSFPPIYASRADVAITGRVFIVIRHI